MARSIPKFHLKKNEYGYYYAQWFEAGKLRKKTLETKDQRIAKMRIKDHQAKWISQRKRQNGQVLNVTLFEFEAEFLAAMAPPQVSPASYRLYKEAMQKAKDCWGDIPMIHVTERHVDAYRADLARTPGRNGNLTVPTINKHLRHLARALNKALAWEYIPKKIPVRLLEEEKSARFLTMPEIVTLLESIQDPEFYDFVSFALYTGLRSGEILRLQWPDIDNPLGFIRVDSQQKNKQESRIPINTHARAILDRCRDRGHGQVFRWTSVDWISRLFKRYSRAAKLPEKIRFHDMRHTFASYLAMQGTDGKAIQDLMRHKSFTSTQVYMNLSPERLREASESLVYDRIPEPPTGGESFPPKK